MAGYNALLVRPALISGCEGEQSGMLPGGLVGVMFCNGEEALPIDNALTQLCVVGADGEIAIDRLAATNLLDSSQDIRPDPENPLNSLFSVRLEEEAPLTVVISPQEGLQLVEFDVYPSKDNLEEAEPVLIVECDDNGCGRWDNSRTRDGRAIHIPPADLRSGYVVIVHAFVHRVNESGTISWGLLIDS